MPPPADDSLHPPLAPGSPVRRPRFRGLRRLISHACWLYLIASIVLALVLHLAADRWWLGTMILFGPRWLWLLPLAILLPAVLLLRRRRLWILALATVVTVGPVMDLCLPWRAVLYGKKGRPVLRVLTCNVHEKAVDPDLLAEVMAQTKPDIVALQVFSISRRGAVFSSDWFLAADGEQCVASRYPIRKIRDIGDERRAEPGAATWYEVQTPQGPLQVIAVHLQSPHVPLRAAIQHRPNWQNEVEQNSELRSREAVDLKAYVNFKADRILIVGDFNMPCESVVYQRAFGDFSDAFTTSGMGFGWTYFMHGTATRIDHILSGPGLISRSCWVAPTVGSPHRPLVADIEWGELAK